LPDDIFDASACRSLAFDVDVSVRQHSTFVAEAVVKRHAAEVGSVLADLLEGDELGVHDIVRSASISSDTFMVPSSAANAAPDRPQTMIAVISGASDRDLHHVGDEHVAPYSSSWCDDWNAMTKPTRKLSNTTIGTPSAPARSESVMTALSCRWQVAAARPTAPM